MKTDKIKHRFQQHPTSNEIAFRAYEIYERVGRPEGRHLDHWLAAEAQLAAEHADATRALGDNKRGTHAPGATVNRSAHAPILLPPPAAS